MTLGTSAMAAPSVEGIWKATGPAVPKGVAALMTLRGGKARFTITGPQAGKTITMTATGSYTVRQDQMNVRFSDAALTSKQFTPAERAQIESPQMKARLRQGAAQQNSTGRIKFAGNDKFTFTEKNGKVTVFTRAK